MSLAASAPGSQLQQQPKLSCLSPAEDLLTSSPLLCTLLPTELTIIPTGSRYSQACPGTPPRRVVLLRIKCWARLPAHMKLEFGKVNVVCFCCFIQGNRFLTRCATGKCHCHAPPFFWGGVKVNILTIFSLIIQLALFSHDKKCISNLYPPHPLDDGLRTKLNK